MKVHAKKKAQKARLHRLVLAGHINDVDGKIIPRGMARDTSMKRDYYPQRSK